MGIRFQKRLKLLNGLRVNLSKSGLSWSVGRPGATVNLRKGKATGTVGLPGTGLSYRQQLGPARGGMWGKLLLLIMLFGVIVFFLL